MKTERNILVAFILNLAFSVFEFIGGFFCGSVAIISDSIHDLGDALSIGISFFLEKKSKKKPDGKYTYGYMRYSVLGGLITMLILVIGSVTVIVSAIERIITPTEIKYNSMIIFAVIGVVVNFAAAFFTREGSSINQKAVNLHMLEDVLGWVVVLIGATVMRFTDISIIDPLMSIGVAVYLLINAASGILDIGSLFLLKTPKNVTVDEITAHILEIDGVSDVHHVHLWSIDGNNIYATMHIVTDENTADIKRSVRNELAEHGIIHATLETETTDECCSEKECVVTVAEGGGHHHHHHHH